MAWIAELFETNRIIVLSVYGQVFFVMGLAVALQSRKRSELALARPLPWLAAFGLLHAFVEWGYLFVPIQSDYLPSPLIQFLLLLQLAMKAASFALLLQFGVELWLVQPALRAPTWRRVFGHPPLRLLPALAFGTWLLLTAILSAPAGPVEVSSPSPWLGAGQITSSLQAVGAPLYVGDAIARYLLALPGSVMVLLGLRQQAGALGPLASPPVGGALRLAAMTFGIYAVVGGLIGMPAPIPPASVLNAETVRSALAGVPIEVLRSVTGLLIAVAVVSSLELFERETDRRLDEARRRELLLSERERIGRDLHDGIIQSIYAAGLHLEEASATIKDASGEPPAVARQGIQHVMAELNRITADIRSYIFDLRSAGLDTLDAEEIVSAVAEEFRANTLVDVEIRFEGAFRPRLTRDQADQLRHIAQEAFSNVLRHANARRVTVRLSCTRTRFSLSIEDDGIGFRETDAAARSRRGRAEGLRNMRRRAELLDARLVTRSQPGRGTAISLTMPVESVRRHGGRMSA
jgi:signal transduction histidine kinase